VRPCERQSAILFLARRLVPALGGVQECVGGADDDRQGRDTT